MRSSAVRTSIALTSAMFCVGGAIPLISLLKLRGTLDVAKVVWRFRETKVEMQDISL